MTYKLEEKINIICDSLKIEDRNFSLPLLIKDIVEWCNVTHQNESSETSKLIIANQLYGSLKGAFPHLQKIHHRELKLLDYNKDLVERIETILKELEVTNKELDEANKQDQEIKQKEKELKEKKSELEKLKSIQDIPEEIIKDIAAEIQTLVSNHSVLVDVSNSTDTLFQNLDAFENTLSKVKRYQIGENKDKIQELTKELTEIKKEYLSVSEEISRLSKDIETNKQKIESITAERIAFEKKLTETQENFTRHYDENLKVAEALNGGNLPEELSEQFSRIKEGLDQTDKYLTSSMIVKNEQKRN